MPIAVFTSEASVFQFSDGPLVAFLQQAGRNAVHIELANEGVSGNMLLRGLRPTIARAWAGRSVVVLEGLRATGKSTIARSLVSPQNFRTLANATERRRAEDDLSGWLESLPPGAVVDEAQLVPELQLGITQIIDMR